MQFTLNEFELNLTSGSITHQGQVTNIRAKTLLVLTYLITHKDRIVTKQELLTTIWHDVVVQEQVLVQSIKEIQPCSILELEVWRKGKKHPIVFNVPAYRK